MSTLTTHKELVIRQLSIDPEISLKACQKVVPGLTKSNFYKIKKQWREDGGRVDTKKGSDPRPKNKSQKPPFDHVRDGGSDLPDYIDDPDELLMSVAIRELNRPDPSYQWANILLAAKKQKITVQGDENELQRQSISTLVSKLKEKLPDDVKEEIRHHSESLQNP